MKAEKVNFGRYGKAFQEGLVQLIFQDRPFADQITEVLDANFIELEYLRVFLQKMLQFRHRYGKHPSVDAMLTIIKTELDEEDEVIQEKVQDYFNRMHKRELTDIDYNQIKLSKVPVPPKGKKIKNLEVVIRIQK